MGLTLDDSTSSTQRLAIDWPGHVEFGTATPSSAVSFNGTALLSGSSLASGVASSASVGRFTGSVYVDPAQTATVSFSACSGFGSGDQLQGLIIGFNSDKTQMTIANADINNGHTFSYAVF